MEHARSFETYDAKIDAAELTTPRNIHLRILLPEGKEMHFKAGQFVQVFIPQNGDKPLRRSYSIASAPDHSKWFELCVTRVDGGKGSNYLHNLKVEDDIKIMGPLGKFAYPENPTRDIVFIATGSGIAPFRSMIGDLIAKKTDRTLYLLFGNRFDDDILYQQEWETMARQHENFKLLLTLSRPTKWTGPKGYVGDKIAEFVPSPASKEYFICGLSDMINSVKEKLLSLGVPTEQIHFEKYD